MEQTESTLELAPLAPFNMDLYAYMRDFELDHTSKRVWGLVFMLWEDDTDPAQLAAAKHVDKMKFDGWYGQLASSDPLSVHPPLAHLESVSSLTSNVGWLKYKPDSQFGKWAVNGIRLQMGFMTFEPVPNSHHLPVIWGMDQLDWLYGRIESFEATDHRRVRVAPDAVEEFQMNVGDFYERGDGIWRRYLVELRNEWLITTRCWHTGRDPIAEYSRFLKAGGTYYLQYPDLCP